jgi:Na+:H+ antiporter
LPRLSLLMVAASVAVFVKFVPIPYVTALALIGAAAGGVVHAPALHLTRSFLLFVLLPGLLFEAGFNLPWSQVRQNLTAIVALATVGVVLTAGLIALMGHLVLGLTLSVAFLLGSMVAATDPVAVIGVFRRLGIPDRLNVIVQAESLFNDGTGVVLFTIALGIAALKQLSTNRLTLAVPPADSRRGGAWRPHRVSVFASDDAG